MVNIGWQARGVAAGFVGTSLMTMSLAIEKRLRRGETGFVDYDASSHVVTAASNVLHWTPASEQQRHALFLVVHWGYGSAVGGIYPALQSRLGDKVAAAVFFAGCQCMAMTLFATAGDTPPPWRWRRSLLASSLVQHAIYAVAVAGSDSMLRRAGRRAGRR